MPIDLKWVRSDPDQVRKWQNLRRRRVLATRKSDESSVEGVDYNNDDETIRIDLVDVVIRKDELSRQNLKNLQEHKKCLKQLQVRLRPKTTRQPVKKNEGDSGVEKKLAKAIEERDGQANPEGQKDQEFLPQSPPTSREDLLKEKKEIETKIRLAETDWKASLEDAYKTLCKLASPVTIAKPNGNGDDCGDSNTHVHNLEATNAIVTSFLLPYSGHPRSSLGMDLEEAWRQYTLRRFASYLWVEVPRGIPVVETSSNASQPSSPSAFTSIDVDRAHELWGPICGVSSSSLQADHPVVMLPSWIRLLTESLPSKSVWGEKELPRYTAIWSGIENNSRTLPQGSENTVWLGRPKDFNKVKSGQEDAFGVIPGASSSISRPFSLEIVALMAPSVVDAREIQNSLVEELWNYYGDLLMVRGDEPSRNKVLKRIVVAPPDLHNHEWSRIEIHLQMDSLSSSPSNCEAEEEGTESRTNGSNRDTLRLGWVSHWGDAATRACDMSFAGGGVVQAGGKKKKNKSARNTSTKEYVHLVEASVIDNSSSTWNKILYANMNSKDSASDADLSRQKEKQLLLDVPPVLAPYLARPIPNPSSVPLEDLFVNEKSKRKKKEAVFGVRGDAEDSSLGRKEKQEPVNPCNSIRVGMATQDRPRFPPVGVTSSTSQEEVQKRIRLEKLSCPYDFLFE